MITDSHESMQTDDTRQTRFQILKSLAPSDTSTIHLPPTTTSDTISPILTTEEANKKREYFEFLRENRPKNPVNTS